MTTFRDRHSGQNTFFPNTTRRMNFLICRSDGIWLMWYMLFIVAKPYHLPYITPERSLAIIPLVEYDAARRSFIHNAVTYFGTDRAREVEDALSIRPLFHC